MCQGPDLFNVILNSFSRRLDDTSRLCPFLYMPVGNGHSIDPTVIAVFLFRDSNSYIITFSWYADKIIGVYTLQMELLPGFDFPLYRATYMRIAICTCVFSNL